MFSSGPTCGMVCASNSQTGSTVNPYIVVTTCVIHQMMWHGLLAALCTSALCPPQHEPVIHLQVHSTQSTA